MFSSWQKREEGGNNFLPFPWGCLRGRDCGTAVEFVEKAMIVGREGKECELRDVL